MTIKQKRIKIRKLQSEISSCISRLDSLESSKGIREQSLKALWYYTAISEVLNALNGDFESLESSVEFFNSQTYALEIINS